MLKKLLNLFGIDGSTGSDSPVTVNVAELIEQIKAEESREIPPGRRIHRFYYHGLEIRLDRDISDNYRITVSSGRERRYSFTVFAEQRDYDALEKAYTEVTDFLNGEQVISELPDDELLKGFYYGS